MTDQERVTHTFEDSLRAMDRTGALLAFKAARGHAPPLEAIERLVVPALEHIGTGARRSP